MMSYLVTTTRVIELKGSTSRLEAHYQHADRLMLPLLWGLFVLAMYLAPWWGTWQLVYTYGLGLALIPTLLILIKPGTRLTRLSVAVAFMLFCALHIHQSFGVTELHFGIFVLLAVLLCYRDWAVIVTAAAVAALHHLSFYYLQSIGWNTICFAEPSLGRVFSHAAYVLVETAVLTYIAIWLHRDAVQADELQLLVDSMEGGQQGSIELLSADAEYTSAGASALGETLQVVSKAVAHVRGAALTIHQRLNELADINMEVRTGADRQAGMATEAVQAVDAIRSAGGEGLAKAADALAMAEELARQVHDGSGTMRESVLSMSGISDSSSSIGQITDVIDGIAFQTNILALNAAVEAARAGPEGRGFAVVAGEVRTLAERSARAAGEIRALIETSTQQVEEGSAKINATEAVMGRLLEEVAKLTAVLQENRRLSQEQSRLVKDVGRIVGGVSAIAQDNQGLMQQAGHAVSQLDQATQGLVASVQRFKVGS